MSLATKYILEEYRIGSGSNPEFSKEIRDYIINRIEKGDRIQPECHNCHHTFRKRPRKKVIKWISIFIKTLLL